MTLPKQKPPEVLNPQVMSRGTLLGGVLLMLFALSAGAIYLLSGALGWEGNGRVLAAILAGPLVGSLLFGLWLSYRGLSVKARDK
jgi:hypothetical protein